MANEKRIFLHGECSIIEIEKLPVNLKKRNDKKSIMIAESETVGNEHRITVKDGVEFYEDCLGTLYMKNTVITNVYCVHKDRHAEINIPVGFWKIDKAHEYDYFSNKIIRVKD